MKWFTQTETRKLLLVGGVLLVALGALAVTSLRSPVAMDPFWHLQMGKDWLENGLTPWVDHYSFTYFGHPITNPPVIFQVLLHLVVSEFGMSAGFIIFRFVGFLLTIGAVILLLRQIKATAIIYALIIPVIVLLLQIRAMVRPEILSYTFSVIALILYFRAGKNISVRNVLPMVILMWVWTVYHSSVVGYIIFFGFFVDCAITQFDERAPAKAWANWLLWGLLLVGIGFLNPSWSHPLVQAVTFPAEWKTFIREYLPTGADYKTIAGIYVLILFALLTPVLALKQKKVGMLIVWAVLVYSAIMMRRMLTPSGIVVVLIAAYLLVNGNLLSHLNDVTKKPWNRLVWFVLLISISTTLYSNVERAYYFMRENQAFIGRYPIALADYMVEHRTQGRIFNNYGMGGYLIYRLSPQHQVYIDGRTQILYPVEHMERYENVRQTRNPEVFRSEMDEYSIDQIIWRYSQRKHDLVQATGVFGLDFLDARFALYTRGSSNFFLLGKLLSYPQCWRPEMVDRLVQERQKMDEILPEYSALFPFADLVVGYSTAVDGKAFFDAEIDNDKWFDEMRRFAGYRFFEIGEYDLVVNLLGGVEIRKPKDYLVSAMAKIKTGDFALASLIIEEYANIAWPDPKTEDKLIQYSLYQLIAREKELTAIELQRADELKLELGELGYSNLETDQALDIQSFCSNSEFQP